MVRPILLLSSVLGISVLTAFAGCSSTTNNVAASDGGGSDTGVSHKDSGSSSGGDDSSSGDDSSGGDGSVTSACFAAKPFTSTAYVPVTPNQAVCATADIAAFVKACGDGATQTTCGNWQAVNSAGGQADGGGAGTACGNCILSQNGQNSAYFGPNYPGCIQILDATNGAACAAAQANVDLCFGLECNLCTGTFGDGTAQDPQICDVAAAGAAGDLCYSAYTSFQTKCATDDADGGIASQCSPGSATGKADPDWYFIIGLVCGGADGGTITDGGGGG